MFTSVMYLSFWNAFGAFFNAKAQRSQDAKATGFRCFDTIAPRKTVLQSI
jgi:hypothetical protein